MTDFSERLKQLRINQGVSQQELADYLKVNKQTISGYERGVRRPAGESARDLYEKLADYFNVDTSYLMGLTDLSIRLENPCKSSSVLPEDLAFKYSQLNEEGKEIVKSTIDGEYAKQKTQLTEFKRAMKLNKITTIEDAKAIMGTSAAFGGYASDEQLIAMANAVLQSEKRKRKK